MSIPVTESGERTLRELTLKPSYHKGQDDIANAFYLPCMSRSVGYDRAVAFFSSTIYVIAWSSLKTFVENGGRLRIVCSPALSPDDLEAMAAGYKSKTDAELAEGLRQQFCEMLNSPFLQHPAKVLASLVSLGVLDFRIAFVSKAATGRDKRIFHDKVGIFRDSANNQVVFKGSMNESWLGLASDGNIESVDVFGSWLGDREAGRVREETAYFDALWNDRYPAVKTRALPELALAELRKAAEPKNWPELVDEICQEMASREKLSCGAGTARRAPREHQAHALNEWKRQGRRGLLEHCTGSGKTFTAICAMREALGRQEIPVVIVPSDLLLQQWVKEIQEWLGDLKPEILQCGAGHSRWRRDSMLARWTRPGAMSRIVVTTAQTASKKEFLNLVCPGQHLFVVADEVHRLGSAENRKIFAIESGPRLGLSATPRRFGDPEGTKAIQDYFGLVIQPPFTIRDAIKSGALTPYAYHGHQVALSVPEQEKWNSLTAKIGQLYARSMSKKEGEMGRLSAGIRMLELERARVLKEAEAKVSLAIRVLREHYSPGQRWLVYCDNQTQLGAIRSALHDIGIDATEYHTAMAGDADETLKRFSLIGGVLVSIRCLDEGVDIPAVSHALILASSKNPREFIQRRGRVLRRHDGKSMAFVHDAIVVPGFSTGDGKDKSARIVERELARAVLFGKDAINPSAVIELQRLLVRLGYAPEAFQAEGDEDED